MNTKTRLMFCLLTCAAMTTAFATTKARRGVSITNATPGSIRVVFRDNSLVVDRGKTGSGTFEANSRDQGVTVRCYLGTGNNGPHTEKRLRYDDSGVARARVTVNPQTGRPTFNQ